MRIFSRVERTLSNPNLVLWPTSPSIDDDEPELSAFRGLLIATILSAAFWAVCVVAVWLVR